jgi:hypothetical protein
MSRRRTVASVLNTIRTELTASQRVKLLLALAPDFLTLCEQVDDEDDADQDGVVEIGEEDTVIRVETAEDLMRLIAALPEDVQEEAGVMYLAEHRAMIDQQFEEAAADKAGLIREVVSRVTPEVRAALRKKRLSAQRRAVIIDVLLRRDAGQTFGFIGERYRKDRDWAEKIHQRWNGRRDELGIGEQS